jgi:hypothetical protein
MYAVISFVALAMGRASPAARSASTSPESSSASSQFVAGRPAGGFAAAGAVGAKSASTATAVSAISAA